MAKKNPITSGYHPVKELLPCNTVLSEFKHHCFPGLNLMNSNLRSVNCAEEMLNLYGKPSLNIKKPLPCLFHEPGLGVCNEDFVFKLVREKYIWRRRKKQILELIHKKYSRKSKSQVSGVVSRMDKRNSSTKLPYGIVRLADHLSKNPDQTFKGLYNWYFDNSIACIELDGQPYVLHAGGELLSKLYISAIQSASDCKSLPIVFPKLRVPLDENGPIFGISLSPKGDRVVIRQKNLCSFFPVKEYSDFENMRNEWFSVGSGNYPFISVDCKEDEICTVDANRQIKLWDVSRRNFVKEISLPESKLFLSDKFIRVMFNPGTSDDIIATDRKNVYSFDRRTASTKPDVHWTCENFVEMCEDISLMVPSTRDNYHYVGTSHSILYFDKRSGFMQKWSHMLPQTPSVGHTYAFDVDSECSTEMLIVGCQGSNDMVAIYNNNSSEPPVTCLPVLVPSRTDTLREARANGVLYHPILQNKFDFSLIGLASYKILKQPTLFSLISTGDIFQQKIESVVYCPPDDHSNRLKKNHLSYLEKWENNFVESFLSQSKIRQVVTHTVELNDLITKMDDVEVPEWKSRQVDLKKILKLTKKELESYVDYLAPNLLHDFGILNDSDWEDEEDDPVLDASSTSIGKVRKWLQTSENEFDKKNVTTDSDCDLLLENRNEDTDEDAREDTTSVISIELSEDDM